MALYPENDIFSCPNCGNSNRFGFFTRVVLSLRKDPELKVLVQTEQKEVFVCVKCNHHFPQLKN
jgi:predicted RNA-binding Zn-ribbon protein involved in translation (DUF1610 family)